MPLKSDRITWNAQAPNRCMLAEQQADGVWRFFEQEEGEARWYPRLASPALRAKVEEELASRRRPAVPFCGSRTWRHVQAAVAFAVAIGRHSWKLLTSTSARWSSLCSK